MINEWIDYSKIHEWELYSADFHHDFRQHMDEGRDVVRYEQLVEAVERLPMGPLREKMADLLYHAMDEAPRRSGYPYDEPSDLAGIRAQRPQRMVSLPPPPADHVLRNRIRGAWLGRICGCLLGLPVECWKSERIGKLLQKNGSASLSAYMTNEGDPGKYWIDKIKGCAPADDDTNYTVLAATRIVGRYGRDFTPEQVAHTWLDSLMKNEYCTAERVAYMKLIAGMKSPHSALYKNAYREWIGAQIRGDYYGYINPGCPETAAGMAWRDASVSHVKNGIYGEIFVAAMLAAAAVCDDAKTIIRAGLGEIPRMSRLSEAIGSVISWYEDGAGAAECFSRIHGSYDENLRYEYIHTNPNAMVVAASLLYGAKDFGKSICMAVETGYDTDCNGATVGSIVGMMVGADHIPADWTDPIGGMLDTAIMAVGRVRVNDMVDITMEHMA